MFMEDVDEACMKEAGICTRSSSAHVRDLAHTRAVPAREMMYIPGL